MAAKFERVPNHPSAEYRTVTDASGMLWIELRCACGDNFRRPCTNPERVNYWVVLYGREHLHAPAT